jgi:hypothetical protein
MFMFSYIFDKSSFATSNFGGEQIECGWNYGRKNKNNKGETNDKK